MNRGSELILKRKYKLDDGDGGGEGGEGGDPAAAAAAAAGGGEGGEGGNPDPKKQTPSDREAELLREVMKRKDSEKALKTQVGDLTSKLAAFDGIDLEQVRNLLTEKANAEQAKLIEKGEFERVRQQMVEAHQAEIQRLTSESTSKVSELAEALGKANSTITDLTIGRAFGDSSFVRDSLTLTPSKARVVYGSQFELQEGKVVAYDKPAGASERTLLVDGTGQPLPFDQAIEKIVKADPDHEHLIRSTVKTGAASKTDTGAKAKTQVGSGRDRIAAAVQGGALKLP